MLNNEYLRKGWRGCIEISDDQEIRFGVNNIIKLIR